jgi:hypothetical protein
MIRLRWALSSLARSPLNQDGEKVLMPGNAPGIPIHLHPLSVFHLIFLTRVSSQLGHSSTHYAPLMPTLSPKPSQPLGHGNSQSSTSYSGQPIRVYPSLPSPPFSYIHNIKLTLALRMIARKPRTMARVVAWSAFPSLGSAYSCLMTS